ncbi:glycosyltransferase family 9 protein [Salinimicrobium sp. GXAS 041]|uniref:glycosyltransferase family 9 protein n=1 Tax=Salinimicrobium sp. GXAS 041 TaxID=3400806 RepID=UPI003C75F32C
MKIPKHILVIRLSAMGDVAMMVPVLTNVAQEYPGIKFTLLTKKQFAPLFEDLSNVIVFEADIRGKHKGIPGLKRLAKELRKEGIDAVADLHNVLRSNVLKAWFSFYGIPVKQINKGRKEKKALTRPENKIFKQLKTTHQRYADVFDALGVPVDVSTFESLKIKTLTPEVRKITGTQPKKWLGIAPFAQHASKVYPIDLMEEVLKELEKDLQLQIFLFGGGSKEIEILDQWESNYSNATSMAGKVSFKDELALISNLDAMLSMDSGNGHLAANFRIPVITMWGLTHPFTGFAPYGQPKNHQLLPDLEKYPQIPTSVYGKTVPEGYENAMRSISPEMVVKKIKEVAP